MPNFDPNDAAMGWRILTGTTTREDDEFNRIERIKNAKSAKEDKYMVTEILKGAGEGLIKSNGNPLGMVIGMSQRAKRAADKINGDG